MPVSRAWGFAALILLLVLACTAAPAAPPRYEYTFETLKENMQSRVNEVAGLGWEVHDVTFANLSGYLVCYRRILPEGTSRYQYAFSLATADNIDSKANEATASGWEIFRLVSCAGRLYCLCLRQVKEPPAYAFERASGVELADKANAASRRGWDVQDLGFGDVSGYLLCYRRVPPKTPPSTYSFVTCAGGQVEAAANEAARNGWELLRIVACLRDTYCLAFRRSHSRHVYAFAPAAGKDIESKADAAVAQGWEVYTVTGSPAGDIDYEDAPDLLRSALPFLLCLRR